MHLMTGFVLALKGLVVDHSKTVSNDAVLKLKLRCAVFSYVFKTHDYCKPFSACKKPL
jgi:hypothetical protein